MCSYKITTYIAKLTHDRIAKNAYEYEQEKNAYTQGGLINERENIII